MTGISWDEDQVAKPFPLSLPALRGRVAGLFVPTSQIVTIAGLPAAVQHGQPIMPEGFVTESGLFASGVVYSELNFL